MNINVLHFKIISFHAHTTMFGNINLFDILILLSYYYYFTSIYFEN